jgi:glycerophosphoryl diester phosphodiesterase
MSTLVGASRPFFQRVKRVPEVIAHRGGGGEWPEETLYAFENAIKLGVDIIEMDLHRTIDGELVLMHNSTVDETTDGSGEIKQLTLKQIKELNAAAKWPGMKLEVATLEEVFQTFPTMRMNIEIKQKEPSLVTQFCHLINKYKMTDKVLIASGWNSVLREFRIECPEVATSASILEIAEFEALDKVFDFGYRPETDALQWHSEFVVPIITEKFVQKAHDLNLVVHAWTVNTEDEMQRMINIGVDGIITDYPSTLLNVMQPAAQS